VGKVREYGWMERGEKKQNTSKENVGIGGRGEKKKVKSSKLRSQSKGQTLKKSPLNRFFVHHLFRVFPICVRRNIIKVI